MFVFSHFKFQWRWASVYFTILMLFRSLPLKTSYVFSIHHRYCLQLFVNIREQSLHHRLLHVMYCVVT